VPRSRRAPVVVLTLALLAAGAGAACAPPVAAPPADAVVRPIAFPVVGKVSYRDTWGAARSGGRRHEGQDLMGAKGQVLVAAVDGTVTWVRHANDGLSGNALRITDAEGWTYVYIHLNNDRPGTDDASAPFEQAFSDGVRLGQRVRAGEPVGYLGDSGNAESTSPHLHFEIRTPDGVAVNAYPSLQAASRTVLSEAELDAAAPVGALDAAAVSAPNTVTVSGWALDRVVDDAVTVSVYVNGNPFRSAAADLPRPDVLVAFPGRTGDHGYSVEVPGIVAGTHRFCVVAHNAGDGGGSRRLACSEVAVP